MNTLREKTLLDDLTYLLAGFDTQNVFITDSPVTLNSTLYSPAEMNLFRPFEFLIFKIREFYNREDFNIFIKDYLEKIADLKACVQTVEQLYVALQPEIEMFKDLEKVQTSKELTREMAKDSPVIRKFKNKETLEMLSAINKWINQADPSSLVEISNAEGFTCCYWKDLFKIKQVDLPRKELEGIEDSGKAIFFARVVFGIELVDDEYLLEEVSQSKAHFKRKGSLAEGVKRRPDDLNVKESLADLTIDLTNHQHNRKILETNDASSGNAQIDNTNYHRNDLTRSQSESSPIQSSNESESQVVLSPMASNSYEKWPFRPFCYKNDIKPRRDLLIKSISSLISNQMATEIALIEKLVLHQDCNIFNGLFNQCRAQMFSDTDMMKDANFYIEECLWNRPDGQEAISKIGIKTFNNSRFIRFATCDSTLGSYITKLLKFHQEPTQNPFLSNFQKIGIEFDSSLMHYFIPEKTFVEMKILFRFLFLINASIFYIQEAKTFNFTRVIYLIFMKIKEERIDLANEFFAEHSEVSNSFSIDDFVKDFPSLISELLKKFHLTSIEVFPHWATLLDIAHEFLLIEYKDCIIVSDFNSRVKECVNAMVGSISKHYGESSFTEFLKNLEVEKYL